MEYFLQPNFLDPTPPLTISEDEFCLLKKARNVLNAAFSIEENFDLLVGNYLEIETTSLAITTSAVVRHFAGYDELFELRAEMNRRAVNFLTAARLFVDQLPQKYEKCGYMAEEAKEALRKQYNASFEFRFIEALRNHVQHSGLAIHSLEVGEDWIPPWERIRKESTLNAYSVKQYLKLDGGFKARVLQECPDEVNLIYAMRSYIEALGAVQEEVRATIAEGVLEARSCFENAIKKYTDFSHGSSRGLNAFKLNASAVEEQIAVFLDWDDVRIKLCKRNRSLKNLRKCVVTSGGPSSALPGVVPSS